MKVQRSAQEPCRLTSHNCDWGISKHFSESLEITNLKMLKKQANKDVSHQPKSIIQGKETQIYWTECYMHSMFQPRHHQLQLYNHLSFSDKVDILE